MGMCVSACVCVCLRVCVCVCACAHTRLNECGEDMGLFFTSRSPKASPFTSVHTQTHKLAHLHRQTHTRTTHNNPQPPRSLSSKRNLSVTLAMLPRWLLGRRRSPMNYTSVCVCPRGSTRGRGSKCGVAMLAREILMKNTPRKEAERREQRMNWFISSGTNSLVIV